MNSVMQRSPRSTGIDFHQGGMLKNVAGTYSTVPEAIIEGIQNSIDAGATRVELLLCKARREYTIHDNGEGRTVEEFNQSLNGIGKSKKERDKYGRFGLGMVAITDKCDVMTFTSVSIQGGKYHRWIFNKSNIFAQEKVQIPIQELASVRFDPSRSGKDRLCVWWRTELSAQNYTADKRQGEVDLIDLNEQIIDRFSKAITARKINVRLIEIDQNGKDIKSLRVEVKKFSGRKITEWVSGDFSECGSVRIRLFISKKEGEGRVLIGDDTDNRVQLKQASRSTVLVQNIGNDVCTALLSGYFEGELLCEKLALNPDRKGFVENDALVGFGLCINAWWEKQGKNLYGQLRDTKRQDRYQQLGIEALQNIEKIIDADQTIKGCLKHIGAAIIGIGNSSSSKSTNGNAIGTRGAPYVPRPGEKVQSAEPRNASKTPNDSAINAVHGPAGNERRIAKSRYGINISHNEAATFSQLWKFNIGTGEIEFNTTHVLWTTCDDSNWKLVALQEDCIRQAVTTLMYDEETRIRISTEIQDALARMFVSSLKFGALRRGRSST